jgi:hypothetical protein
MAAGAKSTKRTVYRAKVFQTGAPVPSAYSEAFLQMIFGPEDPVLARSASS